MRNLFLPFLKTHHKKHRGDFRLLIINKKKLCDTLCYFVVKRVRLQPFFYDIPVDDLPQFVYVVGTTVLIVEVVSMFPYVKSQ